MPRQLSPTGTRSRAPRRVPLMLGAVVLAATGIASPASPSLLAAGAAPPCSTRLHRDLDPHIYGEVSGIISPRFMRRLWIHDGYLLSLFQQGGHDGRYLSLYRVGQGDDPRSWTFVDQVSGSTPLDAFLSGDGFLTQGGDLLLVVSSRQFEAVADVQAYRYAYRGGGVWERDARSPVTVVASSDGNRSLNATLARDTNGHLFVAYVKTTAGASAVRYSYSTDLGRTWQEAAEEFTASDVFDHKNARVSPVSVAGQHAMALVYYDQDAAGERLRWNYRLDSDPSPEAGWAFAPGDPGRLIADMPDSPLPSMYRHWNIARDGAGGLHLSYEENASILYARYDGNPAGTWTEPVRLGAGVYSNITTSLGEGPGLIYVFHDSAADAILARAYDPAQTAWLGPYLIGAGGRGIHRRVSSPEHFPAGVGSLLPVIFENENDPPDPPVQVLFSVLRDCQ